MSVRIDTRDRKGECGGALILVVCYLAILTMSAAAFLTAFHRTLTTQQRTERIQAARNLAEAGVEKAIAELRRQSGAYRGEKDTKLGGGLFSVEVTPGKSAGAYRIVSVGLAVDDVVAQPRVRVVAEVALAPDGSVRIRDWEVLPIQAWKGGNT